MNGVSALLTRAGAGLPGAVTRLHRAEEDMHRELLGLSERHSTDHETHFVARDLAAWSAEHVRRLADAGRAHGLDLAQEPGHRLPLSSVARRTTAQLMGRAGTPALLLLTELCAVHREASGVSLRWEILAQSAQAAEDAALTELAASCHPQTLRQLRWTNAQVKELSAQAVLST